MSSRLEEAQHGVCSVSSAVCNRDLMPRLASDNQAPASQGHIYVTGNAWRHTVQQEAARNLEKMSQEEACTEAALL